MTQKKKIVIVLSAVIAVLLILAIVAMILFVLGATTHMFAGHDHVNNYSIDHNGIVLTYGVKSSTQYYHDEDMLGGTLITISADSSVTVDGYYLV